jgi:hypothetical protein
MKGLNRLFLILAVACMTCIQAQAQQLLIWEDPGQVLTAVGEKALVEELSTLNIQVETNLEYRRRCEYLYGSLHRGTNMVTFTTARINSLTEEQKAIRIAMAVSDILDDKKGVAAEEPVAEVPAGQYVPFHDGDFSIHFNHHTTRYFFSPTSYNLRKGELYYSTLYFATHDIQYGITDKFSVGMGTTIALLPFYVTPKYSFRLNEKNSFSVGTLLGFGTWGVDLLGNLGYGTWTYGNQFSNFTVGLGHMYLEESGESTNSFVGNLAAMTRISDFIYFVTENYYLKLPHSHSADYYGTPKNQWGWWDGMPQFTEYFNRDAHYIAGMSGFRFVNKHNNIHAFQFGLAYIYRIKEPVPEKYQNDFWNLDRQQNREWKLFIIPAVSFVAKLGKRV